MSAETEDAATSPTLNDERSRDPSSRAADVLKKSSSIRLDTVPPTWANPRCGSRSR